MQERAQLAERRGWEPEWRGPSPGRAPLGLGLLVCIAAPPFAFGAPLALPVLAGLAALSFHMALDARQYLIQRGFATDPLTFRGLIAASMACGLSFAPLLALTVWHGAALDQLLR